MAENTGLASANLSAGDDWTAVRHNYLVTDIRKLRQEEMTAGATINGATLPVPVYQNTTDNEVYACDADDTDKLNFIGFAITNAVDAGAIIVQHTGIVGGFTGLDEGEKYYVQDTVGTIGKTPGEHKILVGIAISSTELLIMKKDAPWDDWTEQAMAVYHANRNSNMRTYDFCFSDDKQYLYTVYFKSQVSVLYAQRYIRNGSNGKYSWDNKDITVVSGGSINGGGITYHNGYIYCIYKNDSGVQEIKRFDDDLTNGSTQTISGGNNSEVFNLTNDGTDFYTIHDDANLGAKYTLSGTTFTRDSSITMTGSVGGEYASCLTNDGTNLIFTKLDTPTTYSWADLDGSKIYSVAFTGGVISTHTNADIMAQPGYNYIVGLLSYGDSDSDRFVVLRMLPVVYGASPTQMSAWYSISLSIIDKSAL